MAIERARIRELQKPWGVTDPRPWTMPAPSGSAIGEICYERASAGAAEPALLLKILLTSQPLSIQVHPDDAFARSIGLPHGKTEAWHVLGAQPGAAVAVGLKHAVTQTDLRQAVDDGSIADLVSWRTIGCGDTVSVPAGTIHAIGPGLVIAEIQQRSDTTFRLFDHGRDRELHIDHGLAVAHATPAGAEPHPETLANGRTLLAANPHFVFERLELEPDSSWRLDASRESWLVVLCGAARVGAFDLARGEAVFAETERVELRSGPAGVVCLVAYTGRGGPNPDLLCRLDEPSSPQPRPRKDTAALATPYGATP